MAELHGSAGLREIPAEASVVRKARANESLSRKHIRGSSLLLAGRGLSMGVKLLAQVLIVRYLTTGDYGAWTYALSAVVLFRGFATLGLNRAVSRFLAIYVEREQHAQFFGTLGLVLGLLLLASGLVVGGFYAFPAEIGALAGQEGRPMELLFILILLVPLEMLDNFLTGICATFSASRVIFARRYVLGPGLHMAVAIGLVLFDADVRLLAYGYLATTLAGVVYYAWTAVQIMLREGLFRHLRDGVVVPAREIFSYTVPVMTADWVGTLMVTVGPLALGYYAEVDQVALYKVIVPMALLSEVVHQSFSLLFAPAVSRLFAHGDREGIDRLYWRTATWVAVLSFPVFALTFTAAEPLTVFFYGARYEASATILSLLSIAAYFSAALGFNGLTVMVVGKLGWVVGINVAAFLATVGLHVVLVPVYGALGAGIATASSYFVFNLLNHLALRVAAGVRVFDSRYAAPYAAIAGAILLLTGVRIVASDIGPVLVPAVVIASAMVLLMARRCLPAGDTFPELARLRVARAVLGQERGRS